ncbi:NAC domain-containing protein 104-like [Dioscorea cayenensis subsp. rotundata]|uniref:NAC domain-containing protein 104-like n=1 Tax=Dioscorea cayennensis subsp. rotundata TaxID=55577 RepID=A0AB40CH00_DIOCR|nr:NAC domain-containing protein 104-like [Dioscorea cayenensis subsp. rotundata]
MDGLPPGFHFFPSDKELVGHFLYRKAARLPCQPPIIPTLDLKLYKPWELHGKALQAGNYWYFFTRRTTERASNHGYWIDFNNDEPVSIGNDMVGLKKTFVFYQTTEEINTNWVMHEYHLLNGIVRHNSNSSSSSKKRKDPKIECNKWALCRVSEVNQDSQTGLLNDEEAELSCLDEVFLSLDDLDEISAMK